MRLAAVLTALVLALAAMLHAQPPLLAQIDHLVYATPDLDLGVKTIETILGVRATPGGQHPGMGTRNALAALGPASYLEIIGPDPDQPKPTSPRRFGLDELTAPRLTTWVANGTRPTPRSLSASNCSRTAPLLRSLKRRNTARMSASLFLKRR